MVSTGHVLNYLDTRADVAEALGELARAVRPAGVLAIDLMTGRYREKHAVDAVHAKVEDDWVIVTRFSQPEPCRFDRTITVFRRVGDNWRRSDEYHRNLTFDVDEALNVLRDNGIDARVPCRLRRRESSRRARRSNGCSKVAAATESANGLFQTKAITRRVFQAPGTVCNGGCGLLAATLLFRCQRRSGCFVERPPWNRGRVETRWRAAPVGIFRRVHGLWLALYPIT